MRKTVDPIILDFLRELAQNNNKLWFDANRKFYEQARKAFLDFADYFAACVAKIDPQVGLVDVKNCVYRINRDVRFSPDKSPYKRHMGVFVAPGGRNSNLPGYYLHVMPNESFFSSGNYCLASEDLRKLRAEIAAFPEELHAIVTNPDFNRHLRFSDSEKMKKGPRGYEIEAQYADYLKYKSLNAEASYTDDELLAPSFADLLLEDVKNSQPLNAFFRRALDSEPEDVDII